jgi:hypothetical protein
MEGVWPRLTTAFTQIPEILRHPFLNPESPTVPLAQPIKLKFNNAPITNPSIDLLEELAFLAWQAEEWYPCQTYTRIVRHLAAPESEYRWEKRMYHALQAWKPKDPDAVGLRVGEVPQREFCRFFVVMNAHRSGSAAKPKSITRLLKELSVTENVSDEKCQSSQLLTTLPNHSKPQMVARKTLLHLESTARPRMQTRTCLSSWSKSATRIHTQIRSMSTTLPNPRAHLPLVPIPRRPYHQTRLWLSRRRMTRRTSLKAWRQRRTRRLWVMER